jgi:uncharacterized protein (UPF0303 family)
MGTSTYSQDCLDTIVEQERILRYDKTFTSNDALDVVEAARNLAPEYDRGYGIRVTRESDGLVLAQWMADDKAPRNVSFMEGKRLAALGCGHASLYAYVEHELDGTHGEWFDLLAKGEPRELPFGGAFPVRVGDAWVATVSLSGLHEGRDHEVVVRSLCMALGRVYGTDVPVFPGVPA